MIHSRHRARPDSTWAAAAASPRPRPSAPGARPCCPRTREIRKLAPPRGTIDFPRGPTTAAARRPPPCSWKRSRPWATRTATTARGSATTGRTTPSRTARSASRAATACGGGFLMTFRRRPSPSGPSPCGGGAASACAAGCSSVVAVTSAPFSAREAGRDSWLPSLMSCTRTGGPSPRAGCLPVCGAAQGRVLPALSRRIGPWTRPARRLVSGFVVRRPPRDVWGCPHEIGRYWLVGRRGGATPPRGSYGPTRDCRGSS